MNKNVQYLVEGITKDIIVYLMQDNNMDLPSAISLFHNSESFEKLSNESQGSISKALPNTFLLTHTQYHEIIKCYR